MDAKNYSSAKELLITADCGGRNGNRVRLWKYELQKFSDEIGMQIHVRHFPQETSKWNKIEHRLFSYISKNWRGKPLINYETVVNLISNTRTEKGKKETAIEMAMINRIKRVKPMIVVSTGCSYMYLRFRCYLTRLLTLN